MLPSYLRLDQPLHDLARGVSAPKTWWVSESVGDYLEAVLIRGVGHLANEGVSGWVPT